MQYTRAGLPVTAWWPGVDALEGAELGSYTLGQGTGTQAVRHGPGEGQTGSRAKFLGHRSG